MGTSSALIKNKKAPLKIVLKKLYKSRKKGNS